MNVKSAEKKENSTVELLIEVPAEDFDAAVEQAYQKNKKNISVPGFRKGKAPRKIIESMYGANVFYEEAVEAVYPTAYAEAVKEQNLESVAYPSIEIVTVGKEGLTFKAVVTIKPEVKLGEYKGLTAPKDETDITEQDIEREMAPLIERATRLVSVEREAQKGDTAVLDFEGFMEGKPFEGGQGSDYSLELGSHTFVPGFEDGVVGMKAGDEKEIDITFPKEYPPEMANKPAVFKVKVHEVKEKVAPTLDDEFAKDVSEFETLAELKKDLEDKLRERRQTESERNYENALLEQVCENLEVELPDAMVDYRTDEMLQDFAQRIAGQGISFENYMKYMGTDINTMKAQMRPNAITNIKTSLALEAIAAAEGLSVSDEDIEEEIKNTAEKYNMEPDKIKEMVEIEGLKKDLLLSKAAKLVVENGKVGEAPKKDEEGGEPAEAEAEKKPAKKTAARKTTTRKTAAKKTEESGEAKPVAKRTTAKKTAKAEEKPAVEQTEE